MTKKRTTHPWKVRWQVLRRNGFGFYFKAEAFKTAKGAYGKAIKLYSMKGYPIGIAIYGPNNLHYTRCELSHLTRKEFLDSTK